MLTGCMGIPVSYSEEENQFERDIEQLIGSNAAAVEGKLGHPTSRVRLYDSTVFIYARVAEANVLDLLVPVATYKNTALLCYNLVFDANNQLVKFGRGWYAYSGYHSPRHLCQMWIDSKDYRYEPSGKAQQYDPENVPVPEDYYECDYNEEKIKEEKPVYWKPVKYLWSADEEELTVAAESGNPEARLQLYWHDARDGMYWLCRAANQGYPKARYRVAQLYEFGDDGVGKDLIGAYMWYDLAAKSCHPWARKDALRISRDSLSEDERVEAALMIEQWSAIDCKSWSSNLHKKDESVSEEYLLSNAEAGDAKAQWELYKLSVSSGERDFKWLCKAAEGGDYRARWELGYLHLNGLYGIQKDLVLSVMWYTLVESAGYDPKGVDNIREQLTPEQLTEAEHLYDNWIPGQCEHNLVPDNPRN